MVSHRNDEYSEDGFESLFDMQERHFWYVGRHRFLWHAVERWYRMYAGEPPLSAIDLGGGTGGWVKYIAQRNRLGFDHLALGDSSDIALKFAQQILPSDIAVYQVDLLNLGMEGQWDMAFLLDVIEHLPDDRAALEQAARSLKPGGLLFVTTPAFTQFWSYNDDYAQHLRRYRRKDFASLATQVGLKMLDARYFMFFLSPLYLLSRIRFGKQELDSEEVEELVRKQHEVPSELVNSTLTAVFSAETPIGHWLRFPWGTSILGVFQKP